MLQNSYTKSSEAATRGVLSKKVFQAYNFIKKVTLVQIFSCQFCKTSKNTFFTEHLWTTTSESLKKYPKIISSRFIFLRNCTSIVYGLLTDEKPNYIYFFWKCSEKKDVLQFRKLQNNLCKNVPFF